MRYISQILLNHEQVLFSGKLHAILYARGAVILLLALWMAYMSSIPELRESIVLSTGYTLYKIFPMFPEIWKATTSLYHMLPDVGLDSKTLAILLSVWGVYAIGQAFIRIHFTEMVVTDRRIIAKVGVFNITTMEFDRDRLAGVTVYQSMLGRVLNYGWVILEGFSGDIGGFPPIARPHDLQKAVNTWRHEGL